MFPSERCLFVFVLVLFHYFQFRRIMAVPGQGGRRWFFLGSWQRKQTLYVKVSHKIIVFSAIYVAVSIQISVYDHWVNALFR